MLHFETVKPDTLELLKSLTYFEDAEEDDLPVLINSKISWSQVKKKITAAVASF